MKISFDNSSRSLIILEDNDLPKYTFQEIWLRHNCQCINCLHPQTLQKRLSYNELKHATIIELKYLNTLDNSIIQIIWSDRHESNFSLDYLKKSYFLHTQKKLPPSLFCKEKINKKHIQNFDYNTLENQDCFFEFLKSVYFDGIAFVSGVTKNKSSVRNLAEKIGPIYKTIYDEIFNIIAEEKPINIACTQEELDLHMDLVYYESPPGIQVLHCLKFGAEIIGGESIFLDAFPVVNLFKELYPKDALILATIPMTFQKVHYARTNPAHIICRKPIFMTNNLGNIIGINWAPAFEGQLSIPTEEVEKYYLAYINFHDFLNKNKQEYGLYCKLVEDETVVFNNRRILHGRTKFTGTNRHLQGCYLNIDEFTSKIFTLSSILKIEMPDFHVGNIYN